MAHTHRPSPDWPSTSPQVSSPPLHGAHPSLRRNDTCACAHVACAVLDDTDRNVQYSAAIKAAIDEFVAVEGRAPRVLDIGVGTGMLSNLCLLHGAAHVTGVDVNSTMVDLAKVALREQDPSGRRFTVRLVKPGKSQLGDARFDMLVSEILGTLTTSESMFKYLAIYKDQYAPRPPDCPPCRGRPSLACPPRRLGANQHALRPRGTHRRPRALRASPTLTRPAPVRPPSPQPQHVRRGRHASVRGAPHDAPVLCDPCVLAFRSRPLARCRARRRGHLCRRFAPACADERGLPRPPPAAVLVDAGERDGFAHAPTDNAPPDTRAPACTPPPRPIAHARLFGPRLDTRWVSG